MMPDFEKMIARWRPARHVSMNRQVHQVLFQDPSARAPGGYVEEAMNSVRQAFPGCRYRRWGLAEADEFIAQWFPKDVLRAFRCLRPYAYKGDLFKYCLMTRLGGWYVDAGVQMLESPLPLFDRAGSPPRFVFFRSTGLWDAPWNCSMALLYAAEGHPAFGTAIDEVVDHCRRRHYGHNPLCPTMSPLGRALAIHDVREGVKMGQVVDIEGREYNRAFELRPLGLVAARKPRSARVGSVSGLGVDGSNNYVSLWEERQVYGPW